MTKILLACREYAVGVKPPEFSIEYLNFYLPLLRLKNVQVKFFPLERIGVVGGQRITFELKDILEKEKTDLLVAVSFDHNFDKKVFAELREKRLAKTMAIFFDEDTDLYQRSLAWASYLDYLITFYPPAYSEYKRRNYNVLGMDWLINLELYKPAAIKRDIDVSFVGAAKSERKKLVERIREAGINIQTWGVGWPNGPVGLKEMVAIFNRSKINLNLGIGKSVWRWQTPLRIFLSPADNWLGWRLDLKNVAGNLKTILNRRRPQCRARLFEIMACRSFALTNANAPLFGDFKRDFDIGFYDNESDLISQIDYYLAHDVERELIARRAYEKVLEKNLAEWCWEKILKKIGLFRA